MDIRNVLEQLISGESLSEEMTGELISTIMTGQLTPAQTGAILTALHIKGETVEEIVGAAKAMRSHATPVSTQQVNVLDTCGTGGDGSGTFNISTTAALIVAGLGIPVAKHGNRSASSQCGSIDLFERLGVNVNMAPEQISTCLDQIGITVLFARVVHPAMKHAAPVRSELGVRTIFNYLGPLTNPVKPAFQLIGISNERLLNTYASCLQQLGVKRGWIVSGSDGLDEITLTGPTAVVEVTPENLELKTINPEDAQLTPCTLDDLLGGSPEENQVITEAILNNEDVGPKRDAVLLNAGAAIFVAGKAASLIEGVDMAKDSLSSGKAKEKLLQLIELSHQ